MLQPRHCANLLGNRLRFWPAHRLPQQSLAMLPCAAVWCCRQHRKHAPGKGWLLVWTGTAGGGAATPLPTSTTPDTPKPDKETWVVDTSSGASGSRSASGAASTTAAKSAADKGGGSGATLMFPGGPSCTLMAWPSRGGGSWSGCVFTAPPVRLQLHAGCECCAVCLASLVV
jgi:hypothetical protein